MNQLIKSLILKPFLVSAVLTFLSVPFTIRFAEYFKLLDNPKKSRHPGKVHSGIVPRAGGLALYLGLISASGLFLPFSPKLIAILAGAGLITFIGILDDHYDLNPYFRLFFDAAAAGIAVLSGIDIKFITNPFGGIINLDFWAFSINIFGQEQLVMPLAILLAVIWIVWSMHIIGFSWGVEGATPGTIIIAAVTLGLSTFRQYTRDWEQLIVATLAFIIAGVYAGFLPWNFPPQRIMPGYSGKRTAGFLLGILAILTTGKVAAALLVLAIPSIDGVYTLVRRLVQKKSPFLGDRGHLHHKLLDLGWTKKKIALFYWIISAILGVIALILDPKQQIFALVIVSIVIAGGLFWLNLFITSRSQSGRDNG